MYLDSNVLITYLLKEDVPTKQYAEVAIAAGGVVRSEVLVESFHVCESRETRMHKGHGEPFGEVAKKALRMQLAGRVLEMQAARQLYMEDGNTLAGLHLMKLSGLDYTDCVLSSIASEGEKVATSDKELIAQLGSNVWRAP